MITLTFSYWGNETDLSIKFNGTSNLLIIKLEKIFREISMSGGQKKPIKCFEKLNAFI